MHQYFFIFIILFFMVGYITIQGLAFYRKSKEFSRKRTKSEKIDLMLNRIEPRVIFDGYRELKNEEDCYYSSLILEYQMAEIFGQRPADPGLNLRELKDPKKNPVLANRQRMTQIEIEVKEDLDESIQNLIKRLKSQYY